MTGWGQQGPLAQAAGHDLNYIALTGALHAMGRAGEKPAIPLNLVGDFGGGGLLLAYGVVCALLEAQKSGIGQVVDAAMIDGASTLMTSMFAALQAGFWTDQRGTNMLDSGAHFYEVYETADGKYISLGAIEPQFYAALLAKLGAAADAFRNQFDVANWPQMKAQLAAIIKTETRAHWDVVFDGVDACYAPVLAMGEVKDHPHHQARQTFLEHDGVWQPAPAPRFSRTVPAVPATPAELGRDTRTVLAQFGLSAKEIETLLTDGAAFAL
jgi:alpha-methylacyl-CoA racemase